MSSFEQDFDSRAVVLVEVMKFEIHDLYTLATYTTILLYFFSEIV